MLLFENRFSELHFDKTTLLIELNWKKETIEMRDDDFKNVMLKYVDEAWKVKPIALISDLTNLDFPISLDLQAWADEKVNSQTLAVGIKRVAFVMAKEFLSQLSVEQIIDDTQVKKVIDIRYFPDTDSAKTWILS